jgi:hypothetical protein
MNSYISDYETSIETYTTWDETDIESDDDDSNDELEFYEYDETSRTKYNIVLCEKYNKLLHGEDNGEINNHYLTHFKLKNLNNDFINYIKLRRPNIRTEIAECLLLNSEYCVSILKTFWLRLIQRVWKKIYLERKNTLRKRSNPRSIFYRDIFGKWPADCLRYPSLKGMLRNLSR